MPHIQISSLGWKYAAAALSVSALSGLALLCAGAKAEAGYTCVSNSTQIGDNITIEVVATSGGTSPACMGDKTPGTATGTATIAISGSVTSTQVGATANFASAAVEVFPKGGGSGLGMGCIHSTTGGLCSNSNDGEITGVSAVLCLLKGATEDPLPSPGLPGVPVILSNICAVSY